MATEMAERKRTKGARDKECCFVEGITVLPEEVERKLRKMGGLEALKDGLPDTAEMEGRAALFGALSDPIRLLILHSLKNCDLCPCLLKEITGLADSRLSYHLGVLVGAGLVSQTSRRRWRIYRLTEEGRRMLLV